MAEKLNPEEEGTVVFRIDPASIFGKDEDMEFFCMTCRNLIKAGSIKDHAFIVHNAKKVGVDTRIGK